MKLTPSFIFAKSSEKVCRCVDHPICENGEWTSYFSTDTPDGRGDFETLDKVRLIDPTVCQIPTNVDARRISDSAHWSVIGRGRIFKNGFECKNVFTPILRIDVAHKLPQYSCDDYEVRFCCPKRKFS